MIGSRTLRVVWRSPLFSLAQLVVLAGVLVWLTIRGANAMNYNWQSYPNTSCGTSTASSCWARCCAGSS